MVTNIGNILCLNIVVVVLFGIFCVKISLWLYCLEYFVLEYCCGCIVGNILC